jgi:hypothetical protein
LNKKYDYLFCKMEKKIMTKWKDQVFQPSSMIPTTQHVLRKMLLSLAQNNERTKHKDAVDVCLQVILTYLFDGSWGPGLLNFLLRCSLKEHLVDVFKARTLHVSSSLKKMKEIEMSESEDLRQSRTHKEQNDIVEKPQRKLFWVTT